jgi:hypothetical protein
MKIKLISILSLLALLSGCHTYKTSLIEYSAPVKNIEEPTKEGRACNDDGADLLEKIFFGEIDLTVEKARKNGDITNIVSVEKEVGNGLFPRVCTVVKGN